jgi:hypothetical protein
MTEAPATPEPKRRRRRTALDQLGDAARAIRSPVAMPEPFTLKRLREEIPEIESLENGRPSR